MFFNKLNIWLISSLLVSLLVMIPILTVSISFFEDTSQYFKILKETFLIEYIINSLTLLIGVLVITFFLGTGSAYIVSFYKFPGVNFFKWALILSFAIPPYIYAYSLFAFFENYGTAFVILKNIFGEGEYNKHIPKFDGMFGLILSISFSLTMISIFIFIFTSLSLYLLHKGIGTRE